EANFQEVSKAEDKLILGRADLTPPNRGGRARGAAGLERISGQPASDAGRGNAGEPCRLRDRIYAYPEEALSVLGHTKSPGEVRDATAASRPILYEMHLPFHPSWRSPYSLLPTPYSLLPLILDQRLEPRFVDGLHVGLAGGDAAGVHELHEGVVHQLHARRLSPLDDRGDHRRIALADHVGQAGGLQQDLVDRAAALAVGGAQEELRDDAGHRFRKRGADLRLLVRGEGVDQPVDRVGGAVGVQGAEDQGPHL